MSWQILAFLALVWHGLALFAVFVIDFPVFVFWSVIVRLFAMHVWGLLVS